METYLDNKKMHVTGKRNSLLAELRNRFEVWSQEK